MIFIYFSFFNKLDAFIQFIVEQINYIKDSIINDKITQNYVKNNIFLPNYKNFVIKLFRLTAEQIICINLCFIKRL